MQRSPGQESPLTRVFHAKPGICARRLSSPVDRKQPAGGGSFDLVRLVAARVKFAAGRTKEATRPGEEARTMYETPMVYAEAQEPCICICLCLCLCLCLCIAIAE